MSINQTAKLSIGNVSFENVVFLAPMSGVSDLPFRQIARRFGAGMVVSEMVASENLCRGKMADCLKAEGTGLTPNVVQLAGRESRWMAEGARIAEAAGADIIDINMGCPSKRVTTGYSGSALMKNLDHAVKLIDSVVGAVNLPVSLKMRLGWDDNCMNAPELAKRAENSGIGMITVHGRTRCQFFKGKANWSAIRDVVDAVGIPVIANGDCGSLEDARNMLIQSGARGIMVGRASYGKPWLAGSIARALNGEKSVINPTDSELFNLIIEHYESMLSHYGNSLGVRVARKHLSWYFKSAEIGDRISPQTRQRILTSGNPGDVVKLIANLFDGCDYKFAA